MIVINIMVLSLPRLCYSRSGHSFPDSKGACYIAWTYQLHPHATSSLDQDLHPRGLPSPPLEAGGKSCEDRSLPSMDVRVEGLDSTGFRSSVGVSHIGKLRFGPTVMKGRAGPDAFSSFFLPGVPAVTAWKSPQTLWDLVLLTFLLLADTGLLLPDRLRHEDCH